MPVMSNVEVNRSKEGAAPVPQETCLTQESVPTIVLHNQRGLVRVRESPKLEWTRGEPRWRSWISCWMGGR
jgi:hypothetical protein